MEDNTEYSLDTGKMLASDEKVMVTGIIPQRTVERLLVILRSLEVADDMPEDVAVENWIATLLAFTLQNAHLGVVDASNLLNIARDMLAKSYGENDVEQMWADAVQVFKQMEDTK